MNDIQDTKIEPETEQQRLHREASVRVYAGLAEDAEDIPDPNAEWIPGRIEEI